MTVAGRALEVPLGGQKVLEVPYSTCPVGRVQAEIARLLISLQSANAMSGVVDWTSLYWACVTIRLPVFSAFRANLKHMFDRLKGLKRSNDTNLCFFHLERH